MAPIDTPVFSFFFSKLELYIHIIGTFSGMLSILIFDDQFKKLCHDDLTFYEYIIIHKLNNKFYFNPI